MRHLVHSALHTTRAAREAAAPDCFTVAFRFADTADAFAAALRECGRMAHRSEVR